MCKQPTTVTDTVAVTSTSTPAARVEETTTTIPTAAAVSGKGGKGGATTTIKATTEEEPVTSVDITTDYVDGEDRQGSGSGSGEDKIDPATSDSPKGKKAESKSKSKGKGKDGGKKKGKVTAANAQTEHHGSIAAIAFSVMGVGCLAIAVAVRKLRQRAAYDANLSDDEYATPMTPGRAEKVRLCLKHLQPPLPNVDYSYAHPLGVITTRMHTLAKNNRWLKQVHTGTLIYVDTCSTHTQTNTHMLTHILNRAHANVQTHMFLSEPVCSRRR